MDNKLKPKLKQFVKHMGVNKSIELLGQQSLIKECFKDEDPIRFMDDYIKISSIVDNGILIYKDKIGNVIFFTNEKINHYTFFSHKNVWIYFSVIKGMDYDDIQVLLSTWLNEYYPELGNTTAGNSFRYDE